MTDKPCQKFNLVVYRNKGKKLKTPIFHENVYIYNDDHDMMIYAYDVIKFHKNLDDIVEIMYKTIGSTFKYNGIHVNGLELIDGNFYYQNWLVTNLNREELEKEGWYGY